jgi:hypothetical protein
VAVDPNKPRKILVVHGVQSGQDEDINVHKDIKELIISRLGGVPLKFETDIYRYENVSDKAQSKVKKILSIFFNKLTKRIPFGNLLGTVIENGIDVVGDVVIKLKGGSTAEVIRDGLIKKIESIYGEGNPLYIVAHSLGSIYAFDAVNQLIKNKNYFNRDTRKTWPVQALVTMGSPIGLSMFKRNKVSQLGMDGRHYFRWINYWARTDPVVSGNFYGKPKQGYQIAEKFDISNKKSGWGIKDSILDIGKSWLMAHTGYWDNAAIGDDLVALIES